MPRKLEVSIVADAAGFKKGVNEATSATKGFGKSMSGMAKMAALGAGAAGIGAAVVALKSVVGAAQESEAAESRLTAAFDAAKVSAHDRAAAAAAVSATSRTAALDDEALSDTLAQLTRSTGDVTKAQEGMALAADIARARNISLEAATKIVEKGLLGNENAFKRVGLAVKAGTTATEAFGIAQAKFAGAAEAHGNTAAGAQEKLGIAFENLQEKIGAKLLPVFASLMTKLVEVIAWTEANWPRFQQAFAQVSDAVKAAIDRIRPILDLVIAQVTNVVQLVKAIIDGDWSRVWQELGDIVTTAIKLAFEVVKTLASLGFDALKALGAKALEGLKAGLTGLAEAIRSKIQDGIDAVAAKLGAAFDKAKEFGSRLKDGAISGITGIATSIGERIVAVITAVGEKIGDAFTKAKELGGKIKQGAIDGVTGIASSVKAIVHNVIGAIGELAQGFYDKASALGGKLKDGVVDGLKGIGGAVYDVIKAAVNAAVSGVNSVIGAVNSALEFSVNMPGPLPDINVNPPDIGSIRGMATGGIVKVPTLALLGEKGPEAVVPLGRGGSLASAGGYGGTSIVVNVSGSVVGSGGMNELANIIRDRFNEQLRSNPRLFTTT